MILTLALRSLNKRLTAAGSRAEHLDVLDVPQFAMTHLCLRGLNVPAKMLKGWGLEEMDRLRDRADKAGCPCLVLVQEKPLPFGDVREATREGAADRVRRLAAAAHRLGCNSIGIHCGIDATKEAMERAAAAIKQVMPAVERMELNLLIAPHEGLTNDPDHLVELVKKIGGFRIGSLPSFGHAAQTGDAVGTLRKLAPYAGAIHVTTNGFTRTGNHREYDLVECVKAVRSVGFANTLAIDYQGKEDPVPQIDKVRDTLEEALAAEA